MQPSAFGEGRGDSRASSFAALPPPGGVPEAWRPPPTGPGFGWRFFDWLGALGSGAVVVAASVPGYGVDEGAFVEDILGGSLSGICSGLPGDLQADCQADARDAALQIYAESSAAEWTLSLWSHTAGAWTAAMAIVVVVLLLVRGLQILPRRVNVYFLVLPIALLQAALIVFTLTDQSNVFSTDEGGRQQLASDLVQLEFGAYAGAAAVGVVLVAAMLGFLRTGGAASLGRGLAAAQHRAAAASLPREMGSWQNPSHPEGPAEPPPDGPAPPAGQHSPGSGRVPGSSSSGWGQHGQQGQ